MFYFTIAMH